MKKFVKDGLEILLKTMIEMKIGTQVRGFVFARVTGNRRVLGPGAVPTIFPIAPIRTNKVHAKSFLRRIRMYPGSVGNINYAGTVGNVNSTYSVVCNVEAENNKNFTVVENQSLNDDPDKTESGSLSADGVDSVASKSESSLNSNSNDVG
ncbi:uncharacterized protein LOC117175002 [Belonocnema kinseyi]|uniref:uncharacterized protein LOC117175002 n=1 Tax=Belonocnema kinseyi TaxID=2817044 RepID=UPI00143D2A48|nr:uncharacterized protein LOC117175002 [Belonocnema kinseyi]